MRDTNSTLGAAGARAIELQAARRRAFEGPGTRIVEPKHKARDKARAEREAEAATWIETVKARRP